MEEIYLDNAATTKPYPEVITKMNHTLTKAYGNPSSLHGKGLEAEKLIKTARKEIANKLKIKTDEIYFTSGGTEANNLAIKGTVNALHRYGNRIITSSIEHPSVLNVFKRLEEQGYDVKYLDVDQNGVVDLEQLEEYLTAETILVSIMGVNNELGSIQPLAKIGKLVASFDNLYFHVDGVQAFTKLDLFPAKLGVDLYSISAHKVHGPKGVGALYIKDGTRVDNLISGSKQESGVRPGTENVPGIVGFGEAVKEIEQEDFTTKMYRLKKLLVTRILNEIEDSFLNGPTIEQGVPHIANISFAGIKGEILVHSLERDNIYLSTGAACSSRLDTPSYVLEGIGVEGDLIEGAIRFSLSSQTTKQEINHTVNKLKKHVTVLKQIIQR
ncbi:cysteine desulfurase [Natroniella sulfidigena]|uniref:cysteine desulfurase family protein n=1 Tax=Natroniella sulfidigena TaxID=723921 RepID=UPI00200B3428|nr:cysteine desulfurase family protein [Natroniella sulfidigena]MCK8817289.1 cysteine desulfurase [Natroniella sulfidigena]